MARPSCGVNIPSGTPSSTAAVTGTVGGLLAIAGAYGKLSGAVASVGGATWAAAALAVVIVAVIAYFAYERCKKDWDGQAGCMSGVIEKLTPAFTGSTLDQFLPCVSQHDRVDVVVKSAYWDLIEEKSAYVYCSQADNSPMVPAFYYNRAVCDAGVGGIIGAAAGGALGVVIAAAAIAAIGCATLFLCILALIVAVLIVAFEAGIGAIVGSQVGMMAGGQSGPSLSDDPSSALVVGEYVSVTGNLMQNGDLENALVFYFVTNTAGHGYALNPPSFSYTDPDANLLDDTCQAPPVIT